MILGYDPMAGELLVDLEDGRPPLEVKIGQLKFKLYAEGGVVYVDVASARELEIHFKPVSKEPSVMQLASLGLNAWLVEFVPLRLSDPGTL